MNAEQLRWVLVGTKNKDGSYILPDSVRVPCDGLPNERLVCIGGHLARLTRTGFEKFVSQHVECHGLGYVPAKDLETWMQAAWETHCRLNHLFSHTKLIHLAFTGYSGLDKFVEMLAELLQSRGIKLEVYKEEEQEAPKQHEVGP